MENLEVWDGIVNDQLHYNNSNGELYKNSKGNIYYRRAGGGSGFWCSARDLVRHVRHLANIALEYNQGTNGAYWTGKGTYINQYGRLKEYDNTTVKI